MDKFEFYKELYYKELERKEHVSNALNTPMAIISGLITGIYILATTFSYETSKESKMIFIVLLSASLIPLTLSVLFLCLAFIDKKAMFDFKNTFQYKSLSYTTEILNWQRSLDDFYSEENEDPGKIMELSNLEFKKALINQMCQFTDVNITTNDSKNAYIFRSKVYIIYSLLLAFFTIFPYGYSMVYKPVKIEDSVALKMILDKYNESQKRIVITKPNAKSERESKDTIQTRGSKNAAAAAARKGNKRMGNSEAKKTK